MVLFGKCSCYLNYVIFQINRNRIEIRSFPSFEFLDATKQALGTAMQQKTWDDDVELIITLFSRNQLSWISLKTETTRTMNDYCPRLATIYLRGFTTTYRQFMLLNLSSGWFYSEKDFIEFLVFLHIVSKMFSAIEGWGKFNIHTDKTEKKSTQFSDLSLFSAF